ncbi:MAG: DUF1045 domain-containing protein [Rhizobiaceae bacterium]
MRYAIYFTPAREAPLGRVAADWLGRCVYGGAVRPRRVVEGFSEGELAFHTASARRYGFHATLKAPFRLASDTTEDQLVDALDAFCATREPVLVPRAVLTQMAGFFALVPSEPHGPLNQLAADVVRAFEPFRAPLTETEIARRNPDALSPAQLRNLHGWGYPYIFDEFRFHMTLTGRASPADSPRLSRAIGSAFGGLLDAPLAVDTLALFVEPEPGAPFVVHTARTIGPAQHRKSA